MTYIVEGKTFTKSKEAFQYAKALSMTEMRAIEIKRNPIPYKHVQLIFNWYV